MYFTRPGHSDVDASSTRIQHIFETPYLPIHFLETYRSSRSTTKSNMSSTQSGPRTKRPCQPSISSFFTQRASNSKPNLHTSVQPVLPTDIQSSLLNVGMRVRKAVPSGYHTKDEAPSTGKHSSSPLAEAPSSHSNLVTRPTELAPIYGIHKVGGYAQVQSLPPFAMKGGISEYCDTIAGLGFHVDEDELDPSSQTSLASTVSTDSMPIRAMAAPWPARTVSRKRSHFDDDTGTCDAGPIVFEDVDEFTAINRPILQATTRHPRLLQEVPTADYLMDVDADFDDAIFLQPPP